MRDYSRQPKPRPKSLAYFDDLTGLYNRRYLEIAQRDCEELQEKNIPYAVAIIDIDHFKRINDTHGHLKGDEVIKEFARFLLNSLRAGDSVVRYGGDEFVCVMANAEAEDVHRIYGRLLERCKKERFSGIEVMISAGLASFPADAREFSQLLQLADQSLYDAKRSGRGRLGIVPTKRIQLPTTEYIGREREREMLRDFLVRRDDGIRAAIIEGNAGIGKTRFVREVLNSLSNQEILWSDCLAFFGGIPYYPIREMIKYKIRRQGKKVIKDMPLAYRIELGKLIPELIEGVKDNVSQLGLVMDKYRLYESISRVIGLGRRGKIIVIDNMQWADQDTTESLKYLLRSLRNNQLAFLFIYREEEKNKLLENFISYVSHETVVRELKLDAFGRSEIIELIALTIGENPKKGLAEYIEKESGGNPLYVEEVLKGLNEHGYLQVVGDSWRFNVPDVEIIPKSIEDINERRYQSLSNEGREIIEIASVIGWFDIEIIKSITGYNEGHIIGMAENIKRVGLAKEHESRIKFQDELTRSTIYQNRVRGMRARMLHKKVGEKVEERYRGREREVIEELAFHFYRAGEDGKSVKYCIEAGDRAKEKYANESAIKYYTWAEELLTNKPAVEQKRNLIDLLLKRAYVYSFVGDYDRAFKDLESGLKDAEAIRDQRQEANIRYYKSLFNFQVSQYRKSIEEATRCLAIYKRVGDKKGIADTFSAIANTQGFLGAYKKTLKNYREALKISKHIEDKLWEARAFNNVGIAHMYLGDNARALKFYGRALKLNSQIGDKYLTAATLNNIGSVYSSTGKYDKSLKAYEDALVIIKDLGNKFGEALILGNIGAIHNDLGDYGRALKCHGESLKVATDIDNKYYKAHALMDSACAYRCLGDYSLALKCFKDAQKIVEEINSSEVSFNYFVSLGYFHLTIGQLEKAKTLFDKAYYIAETVDSKEFWRGILGALGELYLLQKNFTKFEKTVKRLEDFPVEVKSEKVESIINILRGRYCIETKDFEEANRYLKEALKLFEGLGERLNIGEAYYYLGVMEIARKRKLAAQRALEKALQIFRALGAKGWEKRATKTLKQPSQRRI